MFSNLRQTSRVLAVLGFSCITSTFAADNPAELACLSEVEGCLVTPAEENCCGNCCRAVCCPQTKQVEEEKTCRLVKCEKVAVPAITLPWEQGGSPLTLFNCLRHLAGSHATDSECASCNGTIDCGDICECCGDCCQCGPTRCGTVRTVHVLDEDTYDVKKCETTWEIGFVPTCCKCGGCARDCK